MEKQKINNEQYPDWLGSSAWDVEIIQDNDIADRVNEELGYSPIDIKNLEYEDFKHILSSVNNIVTGGGNPEITFNAPNTEVYNITYGIDKDHRDFVVERCLDATKTLSEEEALSLLYYTLGKTYAFIDGNGRTSRVLVDNILGEGVVGPESIGHEGKVGISSKGNAGDYVDFEQWQAIIDRFKRRVLDTEGADRYFVVPDNVEYDGVRETGNGRSEMPIIDWCENDKDIYEAMYISRSDLFVTKNRPGYTVSTLNGYNGNYIIDSEYEKEAFANIRDGLKVIHLEIANDIFLNPDKYIMEDGELAKEHLMKYSKIRTRKEND